MFASTVILTTRASALLRRFCHHYWDEHPVVLFDDGEASLDFGVEGGIHLRAHPTYLTVNIATSSAAPAGCDDRQALNLLQARVALHFSPLHQPRWLHHLEALV